MLQKRVLPYLFQYLSSSSEPHVPQMSRMLVEPQNSILQILDPCFESSCPSLGDWSIGLDIVSNQEEFTLNCTSAEESTLRCESSALDLRATLTLADELLVHWSLTNGSTPLPIDEVALVLSGPDQERSAWLSNGFQSWSMSGALQLRGDLGYSARSRALEDLGDQEVARQGREFSWWHTWVAGNGATPIVAGVVSANRFKSWLSAGKRDGVLTMRLHQIGRDEAIELAPEAELRGEPFFIQAGELEETLQRYAGFLTSRKDTAPRQAPSGWNSWYQLWDSIDAGAITENADFIESVWDFESDEAPFIVVDDGWQKAWGSGSPIAALRVA